MAISVPARLSPVHAATAALGARYAEHSGWQIPDSYTSVEAELAAARAGVGLADISGHGKLYVEGAPAAAVVQAAFGQAPAEIGAGASLAGAQVFRLRPDQFFVVTAIGAEAETQARLNVAAAAGGPVTITDVTHGLAAFGLVGPQTRALLSQLSALDFGAAAFPNRSLKITSLAKAKHLILRQDRGGLPAFTLFGAQSLSAYVWSVIRDAGQACGLAPLGLTAWVSLEG